MAIKIWNPQTGKWDIETTRVAKEIEVFDKDNRFNCTDDELGNKNVESCLSEMKKNINNLEKDVKYIYENGTMGGGGGGTGGSALPVVTIIEPSINQIMVNSTDKVTIKFKFTSPNRGAGVATLICAGTIKKTAISQSDIFEWEVGPFSRNSDGYRAIISVTDSQGYESVPEEILIVSGAIDISSTYNKNKEYTLEDEIKFPLTVEADSSEGLVVHVYLRGQPLVGLDDTPITRGSHVLNLGKMQAYGANKLKVWVTNAKYKSQELNYNILISDSEHLFMSSDFEPEFNWNYGEPLSIDYRISMKNQYRYNVEYFINDMENPRFSGIEGQPSPKLNYWELGATTLEIGGPYHLRITAHTLDGINHYSLDFQVTIVTDGFTPLKPVDNPIFYFKSDGKQSTGSESEVWKSEIGSCTCNLYGFNNRTNGFINNELCFDGKSYGIIDYAPFKEGLGDFGFTFEITYKSRNTGDPNARVVHCNNEMLGEYGQGFYIDTEYASFNTNKHGIAKSGYEEDAYITKTFVVNPSYKITPKNPQYDNDNTLPMWSEEQNIGIIKIFTNASIDAATYFPVENYDYSDDFVTHDKIIIGARCNNISSSQDLTSMDNFASCEIKSIRAYARALSDEEVLQNYIAMQDMETQKHLIRINELKTENENLKYDGMPKLEILDDLSNLDENKEFNTVITYKDPAIPTNNITAMPVRISWQGTSSKDYPVKNYTIKMYTGDDRSVYDVTYTPNEDWLPEYRWTLKANYMDSSQANNIGSAKFIYDFVTSKNGNLYPQQQSNAKTRCCIDGIPIRVYIAGVEAGIYTFNIDRYAQQNYGFSKYKQNYDDEGKITGVTITNEPNAVSYEISGNNTASANFESYDFEQIKTEFKHRFNYRENNGGSVTVTTVDEKGVMNTYLSKEDDHTELMALMKWIATCTDEEFFEHAKDHFSIPHLIDYYLICQLLGLVDSLGKFLLK